MARITGLARYRWQKVSRGGTRTGPVVIGDDVTVVRPVIDGHTFKSGRVLGVEVIEHPENGAATHRFHVAMDDGRRAKFYGNDLSPGRPDAGAGGGRKSAPCATCGGYGPHPPGGHPYSPAKNSSPCKTCGGTGTHAGHSGHAYDPSHLAVQTGPRGGRFTTTSTGQKHYVGKGSRRLLDPGK